MGAEIGHRVSRFINFVCARAMVFNVELTHDYCDGVMNEEKPRKYDTEHRTYRSNYMTYVKSVSLSILVLVLFLGVVHRNKQVTSSRQCTHSAK
jgi:hypothetical protein